jgi:hypothetical protein
MPVGWVVLISQWLVLCAEQSRFAGQTGRAGGGVQQKNDVSWLAGWLPGAAWLVQVLAPGREWWQSFCLPEDTRGETKNVKKQMRGSVRQPPSRVGIFETGGSACGMLSGEDSTIEQMGAKVEGVRRSVCRRLSSVVVVVVVVVWYGVQSVRSADPSKPK